MPNLDKRAAAQAEIIRALMQSQTLPQPSLSDLVEWFEPVVMRGSTVNPVFEPAQLAASGASVRVVTSDGLQVEVQVTVWNRPAPNGGLHLVATLPEEVGGLALQVVPSGSHLETLPIHGFDRDQLMAGAFIPTSQLGFDPVAVAWGLRVGNAE